MQISRFVFVFDAQVKEEMLFEALTTRKTVTVGERLIVPYKLAEVRLKTHFNTPLNSHTPSARCFRNLDNADVIEDGRLFTEYYEILTFV